MKKGYYFFATLAIAVTGYLLFPQAEVGYQPMQSLPSSISDNDIYPQFCLEASRNPAVFKNFKRDPIYTEFLEHVGQESGAAYLQAALQQWPELSQKLSLCQKNDTLGNPITYSYIGVGLFSPTTLRYIKVASDLKKLFGSLDGFNIVEIGGGYGGQCVVLSQLFHIKSYTLIDLQGPLELAKTYLDQLGIYNVTYEMPEKNFPRKYDLVISNFAFSECAAPYQKRYITEVLAKAPRGYLTMNQNYSRALTESQLMQELHQNNIGVKKLAEEPQTGTNNYLLVW